MKRIKAFKIGKKQYYYKNRQAYNIWQTIGTVGLIALGIANAYIFAFLIMINK